MKKIEQVFREVLFQAMEKNNRVMTQLQLSKKLGFSLSTVNLALKKLEKMGSVNIQVMNFRVIDVKKILYLWASFRDLEKDIIYQTRLEVPVREIEQAVPDVQYAAYSAYKFKYNDVPSDYSEVYLYAGSLDEIKKRFPESKRNPNLFILKKDNNMDNYPKTGTIGQVFVDLWNLKQWYAAEFVKEMEKKL